MTGFTLFLAIVSFAFLVAGIIFFIRSLMTLSRCSDEVEAVVLFDEWKPEYKTYVDGRDAHRSQGVPTGYTFVKYKYKGLIIKTKVKSLMLWEGTTIKVRVNPKKPNECCMPRPRFGGLVGCWIFSAFLLCMLLFSI